jgi:hypothetical protein
VLAEESNKIIEDNSKFWEGLIMPTFLQILVYPTEIRQENQGRSYKIMKSRFDEMLQSTW